MSKLQVFLWWRGSKSKRNSGARVIVKVFLGCNWKWESSSAAGETVNSNDIQIAVIVSVVLWRKSFAIRQGFFCGLREFVANKAAMAGTARVKAQNKYFNANWICRFDPNPEPVPIVAKLHPKAGLARLPPGS